MLRQLEQSRDDVVGYSVGGEITDQEFQQLASELRDAIAMHGRVRVLFRLTDVSLQSFFTALDDRFRFVQEHAEDIERVAIVSDDKAAQWLSKLADAFRPVETRHFPRDEEQQAWAWLE